MKNKMSTTWVGAAMRASIHQSFQTSHTTVAEKPTYAASTSSISTGGETVGSLTVAIRNSAANDSGAMAIEYGLIAALIAVAAIAAMGNIGNKLNSTFNNVSSSLN